MAIRKIAVGAASAMLVATMVFVASARPAYAAAAKVDCDAVMNELNSGKHYKDVAKDLSTTTYQVRKCKRLAKAAAKAQTKSMEMGGKEMASPAAAPSSAMSAPSPAMAAPAAAASPK
jgi:hypothetical protein